MLVLVVKARGQPRPRPGHSDLPSPPCPGPCPTDRQPELKNTPEFRSVRRDLGWWLRERAQVVVAFVRGANELLQVGRWAVRAALGCWGAGAGRLACLLLCTRRS